MDQMQAGTLQPHSAFSMVQTSIDEYMNDELDKKAIKEQAHTVLTRLHDFKVIFGFDGFQQNGCAAPTPYLLVLDQNSKTVYGINLFPCEE